MTNDDDFFASIIERLTAYFDTLEPTATAITSAYDAVQGLLEPVNPDYTAGDWYVSEAMKEAYQLMVGYVVEDDDIEQLRDAMDRLAANAND